MEKVLFDLAILELKTEMALNGITMKAVTLPPPELRQLGRKIKVGGWGQRGVYDRGSATHQVIDIEIHPSKRCLETFVDGEFDEEQMFCAGDKNKSPCFGDSGAGAVHEFGSKLILFGVVSFGFSSDRLHSSCQKETTFQRISTSLPWIYRETKLKYDQNSFDELNSCQTIFRPEYELFDEDLFYNEFKEDIEPLEGEYIFQLT